MSAADDLLQLLRAAHNPVKSTAEPAETEEVLRLSRKRKRDEEHGTLKNKLREELLRKQAQAKESDPKGSWLRSFVHDTWKNTKKDSFAFKRKRELCYTLLRKAKANSTDHGEAAAAAPVGTAHGESKDTLLNYEAMFKNIPAGRGLARGTRGVTLQPSKRKRARGAGAPVKCPEIGFELWTWFVDTARNLKCRIGNDMLEAKARLILNDLKSSVDDMLRRGLITRDQVPKYPKIGPSWVSDWRRRYRVSYRAKTIVYKVARAVLARRLGVFWRNCIRIRYFHSKMFPGKRLRFRAYDQKPFYFNQAGDGGTLASMDEFEIDVRENHHATRARFTALTKSVDKDPDESMEDVAARSHGSGSPRKLAICFKAAGSGARIREKLDVPEGVLLQFGPKGSYRVQHVLEVLEWDLGDADGDGDMEIVFLDWFSAHLHPDVRELVKKKGHVLLFIPGGATPWVAVLDTDCHAPYQREYLRAEKEDNAQQLMNGAAMPATDRQSVLDRANFSWGVVPHSRISETAWKHVGVGLSLDGEEDNKLRKQCVSFWHEQGIPAARERIKAAIDIGIRTGDLTSWDQYTELLEPYDAHPPMVEGEEIERERLGDPDDDDDDGEEPPADPDDDSDDPYDPDSHADPEGGDDDAANATHLPSDAGSSGHGGSSSSSSGGGGSSSGSSGGSSSGSAASGSDAAPLGTAGEEARTPAGDAAPLGSADKQADVDVRDPGNTLQALLELREAANKLGVNDPAVTKVLDTRIRELDKLRSKTHPAVLQALREKVAERKAEQEKTALARQEQRQKEKTLKLETEKANADAKAAKALSDAQQAAAKKRVEELQAEKRLLAARQQQEKENLRLIRLHFAARVCSRLLDFCHHDKAKHSETLKKLTSVVAAQTKRKVGDKNLTVPQFMERTRSSACFSNANQLIN